MIPLRFRLLSDGIDLGFRTFRLSNIPKNIKQITNGVISLGVAAWAFIPGTNAAKTPTITEVDPNLCPEADPTTHHANSDSKNVVNYRTNTGSSYALITINTEPMWRRLFVNREAYIIEKEIKVDKNSRFAVSDLHKLVASKRNNLPILTATLSQITAPLIMDELKAIMARQNIIIPMSFSTLTQCAKDIIPKVCGAVVSTPDANPYKNITGLLPSPGIGKACNISALSLAEGHPQDKNFEQCVATQLQEAITPVAMRFFNSLPSKSTVGIGLLLGLMIVATKTICFDIPRIKQQIRDNFLNREIPNPHNDKLNEIGFDGEIPDEFICPITRFIMHDPVRAADGKNYERNAIEKWFIASGTKRPPMSFNFIGRQDKLEPANELAERIRAFVAEKVAAVPRAAAPRRSNRM